MRTLLLLLAAIVLLASCSQTYRVKPIDNDIIKLVDMDKGFHVGDTVIYLETPRAYGLKVVILNPVN